MNRITDKELNAVVSRINRMTNSPNESWTQTDKGVKANIGNFHISGAYGGVSLHRMTNESGGVENVLRVGYIPKRELYNLMQAFITGITYGKGE